MPWLIRSKSTRTPFAWTESLLTVLVRLWSVRTLLARCLGTLTPEIPRFASDALRREITVYTISSTTKKGVVTRSHSFFFALLVKIPEILQVIYVLLKHNHFNLIEPAKTKTKRQAKCALPLVNPYHKHI